MGSEAPASGMTPERLVNLRRVQNIAPSPCGTWAAVEVQRLCAEGAKYLSDLWRVSVADPSLPPTRITRGSSNDRAPCFRPDGALGFLSNRACTESGDDNVDPKRSQVFVLPTGGGDPHPITNEPLGVEAFRFASKSDTLVALAPVLPGTPHAEQRTKDDDRRKHGPSALHYTDTPVRYWDHWLPEASTHVIAYQAKSDGEYARRDLSPDAAREFREATWDISPDGQQVAITARTPGEDRVDDICLRVIDVGTGEARTASAAAGAMFGSPVFSPDGTQIACYLTQRFSAKCPRHSLMLVDVSTLEAKPLAAEWDREAIPETWTQDGGSVIVTAEDTGVLPAFRVEVSTGSVIRLTATHRGGTHSCLHLSSPERLIGIRSRLHHPPEPFFLDFAPAAEPRLLASLSGWTEAEGKALADWQTMQVDAEDGTSIQSFFLRPAGKPGPFPVVMWIHGGPMSAWGDGWHWRWNPLLAVQRGYAVSLPNPRGSTGFGYALKSGIWGNVWGAQCYRDLMATQDALDARSDIDSGRAAAMGGSFGGYMANWIGGQTDRYRALITHASLYDLRSFWGTTDAARWFGHQLGGVPIDDDEYFARYSPHRFVKSWKSPTLVIHGEKDYRVPIGEGLALYEALRHQGVESELLVFPDENHWILKPRNVTEWYGHVLRFLDKYLMTP